MKGHLSKHAEMTIQPIHTFIWKIASRCNINCSYCYVYHSPDTSWSNQPYFMSKEVVTQTSTRILKHCKDHALNDIRIYFHGGEPLLGGIEHIDMLTSIIRKILDSQGVNVHIAMQSNGLLFTPEIGDLLLERDVSLGISIDGPPEINDIYRVDHQGKPTSFKLEENLKLITSSKYSKIFKGFLTVINTTADPLKVFKYLLSFNPPGIDFLLPDHNYDHPPLRKSFDDTSYGDWLISIFDYWYYHTTNLEIRFFESIMRGILGSYSLVESIGLEPVALVVIETNGDIEALDVLKTSYQGATHLGYNVFNNDFNTVAMDMRIKFRQMGINVLSTKCKECPLVKVCGGGYLPHRYSSRNGFCNPSIYCEDLLKLIYHIHRSLREDLLQLKKSN